jgi:hypothetical protein
MHQYERLRCPLRLHIDDADTPQLLALPPKGHEQGAPVELYIQWHSIISWAIQV